MEINCKRNRKKKRIIKKREIENKKRKVNVELQSRVKMVLEDSNS